MKRRWSRGGRKTTQRGLILLLFFPAFLLARDQEKALSYREALELAEQSPAVQIKTLELQRANKQLEQASTLLPAAPEVDLSYEKSRTQFAPGYFDDLPVSESLNGRAYELGINQQIDVSGSRRSQREEAKHRISLARHLLQLERLQTRSRVREAYLAISVHDQMSKHLHEHTQRFFRLKAAFGSGYFDRRLGAYTSSALAMGIASLQADHTESITARDTAILNLKSELGPAAANRDRIEVQDFTKIPLPDLPDEETLKRKARQGLSVMVGRDRIAMARAAEELASRKILPFVELFATAGKREQGNYGSFSFQNNTAERERFWRFGIRIPLGIFGPERLQSDVAATDRKIAEIELQQLEKRLDLLVARERTEYINQKASCERLYRTFVQSERLIRALESALISRRITYFEFWGEHERLHDILQKMGQARLKAAAALGRMEMLIGEELE